MHPHHIITRHAPPQKHHLLLPITRLLVHIIFVLLPHRIPLGSRHAMHMRPVLRTSPKRGAKVFKYLTRLLALTSLTSVTRLTSVT